MIITTLCRYVHLGLFTVDHCWGIYEADMNSMSPNNHLPPDLWWSRWQLLISEEIFRRLYHLYPLYSTVQCGTVQYRGRGRPLCGHKRQLLDPRHRHYSYITAAAAAAVATTAPQQTTATTGAGPEIQTWLWWKEINLYRSEPSCDVMCVERVQGDINVTIIILTTLFMASPCTSQQQPPCEPRRHLWSVVASSLLRPTPEPAQTCWIVTTTFTLTNTDQLF